jgi:nitrite reductase/ring-hydroxylating ferredoxin subunit
MFVPVAKVDEIEPGTVKPVKAGEIDLALARVGDEFYVTQGQCLHLHGPLGHGKLEDHLLHCPWHGWTYDVRTGLNAFDHAIELQTFEVRVEDGVVQVALAGDANKRNDQGR